MSDEITPRRDAPTPPAWPNDLRLPVVPDASRPGCSDAVLHDREELVQAIFRVKYRLNHRRQYWAIVGTVLGMGLAVDVLFFLAYQEYRSRPWMPMAASRAWYQDDSAWGVATVFLAFFLTATPVVYWNLFRLPVARLKSILIRLRSADARVMPQFVEGATQPRELIELGWEFLHAFEEAYLTRAIRVRLRVPPSADGQSSQQWRVFLDWHEVEVMAEAEGYDRVVDATLGSHVLTFVDVRDPARYFCNSFVLVRVKPCAVDGRNWQQRTPWRPLPVDYLVGDKIGEGGQP